MADEAFALSPISARAAQPSEQDYEAISEAFMETSRGRWFLGEYAKRNRNADTRMVLDAVARIEQSLAAQRQPAPESGLADALVAIRSALDEARCAAAGALDSLALEENLAPIRKGARVIKEISWRWREIGGDGRICDLLDSQVSAIEGACGQLSSAGPQEALSAAFDLMAQRIAGLDERDGAAPRAAEQGTSSPSPVASNEMSGAVAETVQDATATGESNAAIGAAAMPAEMTAEAADAHDEALLEMVALEMGAPDAFEYDDIPDGEPDDARAAEPPTADHVIVAREAEPMAPPPSPEAQPSLQPSPEPEPLVERPPDQSLNQSRNQSLGSTLVASGIVRRPHAAASDPLAPIRRMSQAEKIALFS
jgi:hypothetical protein